MQLAVLGDSTADALPPAAEAGGFELTAHEVDDLAFNEACALSDLFKARSVLPGESHDEGGLFAAEIGLHGRVTMVSI